MSNRKLVKEYKAGDKAMFIDKLIDQMTKQSWLIFSKTLFDMADMIKNSDYKPDERLVKAIERLLRDTLKRLEETTNGI